MRLLNTRTRRLESFLGTEMDIPEYAILSHTWGKSEISFHDISQRDLNELSRVTAFAKIERSCERARHDGLGYIWIDTCCIDKSSSAELSEAINSMFKWYQQSSKCYVLLSDFEAKRTTSGQRASVSSHEGGGSSGGREPSFTSCRWFSRGWTLQELIAPRFVEFFDRNWTKFGTRNGNLLNRLCSRTDISPQVFVESRCACSETAPTHFVREGKCVTCKGYDTLPQTLDSFAVSIKMSWAADRVTTRKEDAAYSLLGLFNINMPMLYGEGDKAFFRLQDAIARQSKDQSILLWRAIPPPPPQERALGCLAPTVAYFKPSVPIVGRRVFNNVQRERYSVDFLGSLAPMEVTDTVLKMNIYLCPCSVTPWSQDLWLGVLDLVWDSDYLIRPAILLEYMGVSNFYRRVHSQIIIAVDPRRPFTSLHFSKDGDPKDRDQYINNASVIGEVDVEFAVHKAVKKEVGILLHQSPADAINIDSASQNRPQSSPLYFLINQTGTLHCFTDVGGSYPPLNRYSAHSSQTSTPWGFKRCTHLQERFFGGIHFINLTFPELCGRCVQVHVTAIWGTHRKDSDDEQRLWCRLFYTKTFLDATKMNLLPSQLYGERDALPSAEIQRRMGAQRQQLTLRKYQRLLIGNKALFPNSCDKSWHQDCIENILEDSHFVAKLTVDIGKTEGLGRTVFELRMTLDTLQKAYRR